MNLFKNKYDFVREELKDLPEFGNLPKGKFKDFGSRIGYALSLGLKEKEIFFFGLMFVGGSAGSTSGGIKIVRHLLMIKSGILEFKRSLHPSAIIRTRYNGSILDQSIIYNISGFFILYMLSFALGALIFGLLGLDIESSLGVSAASLGNVGPAIGDFGPSFTFNELPNLGKWWASFLMLLGRLELFTVLIILSPFFWKKH